MEEEQFLIPREQMDLLYKLQSTDALALRFALEAFEEYAFENGFDKSFSILEMLESSEETKTKIINILYDYARTHSCTWSLDYEKLIEYFLWERK